MTSRLPDFGQVTAVIGAQWGDEGKGKVVDILAEKYDIIARACGGANAGHTIVVDDNKHVFHLLPSGCLHEGKDIVLGAGLVIHLPTLLEEIDTLHSHGIDILPRLHISHKAHIVFDYHKDVDAALENVRSEQKGQGIGTTKRGIGPAYMEKAARTGVRMESLNEDLHTELTLRSTELKRIYDVDIDVQKEVQQLKEARNRLEHCVTDTVDMLHAHLHAGKTMIIEGAQATLLDIDHGTYPYVTSSSTTIAGALQGLGIAPKSLSTCIGVAKAYCTRVGSGIFETEESGERAERLRKRGGEYGSTTGRPRRTGWLSIDDLRYAARINGCTHWNITKLDVLDEEEEIPLQMDTTMINMEGWKQSTAGIQSFEDLPPNAQKYIQIIEDKTGVPVSLIGTGQKREDMIVRS